MSRQRLRTRPYVIPKRTYSSGFTHVWRRFRFKSEDWQRSWEGELPELINAAGAARNPNGGERWSYYLYEKFVLIFQFHLICCIIFLRCRRLSTDYLIKCNVELQGNEYSVAKAPMGVDGWMSSEDDPVRWLDMRSSHCYRDYIVNAQGLIQGLNKTQHFDAHSLE